MRKMFVVLLMLFSLFAVDHARAQTQPVQQTEVKPKSPDVQLSLYGEKIQNIQLKQKLLQSNYQQLVAMLQKNLNAEVAHLMQEEDKVRKENGWDQNVVYDAQTDKWYRVAAQPKPVAKKDTTVKGKSK